MQSQVEVINQLESRSVSREMGQKEVLRATLVGQSLGTRVTDTERSFESIVEVSGGRTVDWYQG